MKPNTYDIPALKFAILVPRDKIYSKNASDYSTQLLAQLNNNVNFIPWEDFDGLSVKDVLHLTKQKHICLSCYTGWDKSNICDSGYVNVIHTLAIDSSILSQSPDAPIDKAVESAMMEFYNTSDAAIRMIYKCFFERYQDNSYEETLQRVQKLITPTFQ